MENCTEAILHPVFIQFFKKWGESGSGQLFAGKTAVYNPSA